MFHEISVGLGETSGVCIALRQDSMLKCQLLFGQALFCNHQEGKNEFVKESTEVSPSLEGGFMSALGVGNLAGIWGERDVEGVTEHFCLPVGVY